MLKENKNENKIGGDLMAAPIIFKQHNKEITYPGKEDFEKLFGVSNEWNFLITENNYMNNAQGFVQLLAIALPPGWYYDTLDEVESEKACRKNLPVLRGGYIIRDEKGKAVELSGAINKSLVTVYWSPDEQSWG